MHFCGYSHFRIQNFIIYSYVRSLNIHICEYELILLFETQNETYLLYMRISIETYRIGDTCLILCKIQWIRKREKKTLNLSEYLWIDQFYVYLIWFAVNRILNMHDFFFCLLAVVWTLVQLFVRSTQCSVQH